MRDFEFKVNLVAVVRDEGVARKSFLTCLEHPAPLKSD
jgi:hypothetical protein